VIIMLVVLFFRKGIMGDKELPHMLGFWKEKLFKTTGKSKAGDLSDDS